MQQPENEREFVVKIAVEDSLEIDRHIARAGGPRAVAQHPQFASVGDDPPQRVALVQVFLQQRVRAALLLTPLVELLSERNRVDWRCIICLANTM